MEKPADLAVSAPSSVSDVLYLIAAHHADILSPETLQKLGHANICYIRGDPRTALSSVNAALNELDVAQPAYSDVIAFRLYLESMVDQDSERWTTDADEKAHAESGAPRIVSLCVESNEHWYSGSMFRGLWLNQSAIQHCHDVAAIWRVYGDVLLAKKLSDMHVSYQASRVICEIQNLVDSSGLHAFGALPEALHSVLYLQSGQFDKAIQSAATAIRIGEQRASIVGATLALSVSAMAHLGLGERDEATASLESFHAQPSYYAMTDSVARTAFAEIALVASQEGPRAAADQIRSKWHLLGTDSACFIEDPTRPAWLVAVAQRAGDTALAKRSLQAIERLARNNHGVSLLETAAEHARTAFAGEQPGLPSVLDFGADHLLRAGTPHHPPVTSTPPALPDGTRTTQPTDPDHPGQTEVARHTHSDEPEPDAATSTPRRPRRLPSLSRREIEIARLVGCGMTNRQVAKQLSLSPHTVNFHLRSIFRKLSISTRVKLGLIIAQIDRQPDPLFRPDQH